MGVDYRNHLFAPGLSPGRVGVLTFQCYQTLSASQLITTGNSGRLRLRVEGFGFRRGVEGFGFRVYGLGFRI